MDKNKKEMGGLPQNVEAEESLLGSILLNNALYNQAIENISREDFFGKNSRIIFSRIIDLMEKINRVEPVTLKEELERHGELEEVGGAVHIASLVDGVSIVSDVSQYIRIIKEKSILRQLLNSANAIISSCYEQEEDTETILDLAERKIFSISEKRIRSGFIPIGEIVKDSFEMVDRLYDHRGTTSGIPTGFKRFDELTTGLQPADFIVIASRPSMGKTSISLNIAQYAAVKKGYSVGIFSLEMSKEQLVMRLLCAEAQVDAHKLRSGYLKESDWGELAKALGTLSSKKIFIDDTAGISALEMRAKARRLKLEHSLDLLIIDYMQLMRGSGRFENRNQEISSISRSIKGLAKELSIPIISLSQLSRAPEARVDKRPQLSDLRESGSIEQDADLVAFIFRPEVYKRTEENEGFAELIIGKQRNGPTDTIKLTFLKEFTKFVNYTAME